MAVTKQEQERARPEVTEPTPGVLRLQLPIRMPGLGHVNCYALPDERGLTVVDPGLPGPQSWKALQARLRAAGRTTEEIHTVVVTHSHPDHFGLAGRLVRENGARMVTHESFELWWGPHRDRGRRTPWGGERFRPPLRRRVMFRAMRFMGGRFGPPAATDPVQDGESLEAGGRRWVGIHTPGHTPDHLCLYDPDGAVLLSGDHVLPTITPHISGASTSDDPLADFKDSLERVAELDVSLVLPAHGHPFDDLGGRTKAIWEHHVARLERLTAALDAHGEADVTTLSHELFHPRHRGFMAESETFAHLEHLRLQGRADRLPLEDGRYRYRSA